MSKCLHFTIRIIIYCFLSMLPLATFAAECEFSELYLPNGWGVTKLDSQKQNDSAKMQLHSSGAATVAPPSRSALSNIPGVFVTKLSPATTEVTLLLPRCSVEAPGRLLLETKTIAVIEFWRIDFNGKIFAYGLVYGTNSGSMPTGRIFFYDVDGNGVFAVAKYPKRLFWSSLEVPIWLKH